MFKIEFNDKELEEIMKVIHFPPRQKRIIQYRRNEYSRQQMADKEITSLATIDREIYKIVEKITKAIEKGMIKF